MRRDERHLATLIAVLCFVLGGGLGVAMATQPIRAEPATRERALADIHQLQHTPVIDKKDPWGRPYLVLERASLPTDRCILSKGPDGKLGTEDDVFSGCSMRVLNGYRLVHAGLNGEDGQKDLFGHPIRFIRQGSEVVVWSYGQDGLPNTPDDQVATFSASAVKTGGK
jgi:hypothetical protein